MKFSVLGSGSKGNCTLVESGSTAILIDAGFSGKEINLARGLAWAIQAENRSIIRTCDNTFIFTEFSSFITSVTPVPDSFTGHFFSAPSLLSGLRIFIFCKIFYFTLKNRQDKHTTKLIFYRIKHLLTGNNLCIWSIEK